MKKKKSKRELESVLMDCGMSPARLGAFIAVIFIIIVPRNRPPSLRASPVFHPTESYRVPTYTSIGPPPLLTVLPRLRVAVVSLEGDGGAAPQAPLYYVVVFSYQYAQLFPKANLTWDVRYHTPLFAQAMDGGDPGFNVRLKQGSW